MHIRSDSSRPDFYDNKRRGNRLLPEMLRGPLRKIIIGDCKTINGTAHCVFPTRVPLTLEIQEHEVCVMRNALRWSEGRMRFKIACYAIDHSNLPTARQLDKWGRNRLLEYCDRLPFRLQPMDKFLFSYLNTEPDLRYVSLFSS
jgi:hypothetical protein